MSLRSSIALLSLLAVAACGGDGGSTQPPPAPPPPPTVDHVTVDPTAATLETGATRQLQATAFDAGNATINGATFTYGTSAAAVATVSTLGLVTAVAPGTATITTTSGTKSAQTAVTVTAPIAALVTLSLPRALIKESDTVRAVATVRNAAGQVITRDVTWSSSDSSVAVVTPLGLILGVGPGGPVTITAKVDDKSATVAVSVLAAEIAVVKVQPDTSLVLPGSTKQLTLTITDEFGNPVINRPVTWSSINPAAATVDSAGKVTAVAVGEATIQATVSGKVGQALIRVQSAQQARFYIEVTNHLRYPVEILQNGVIVGTAEGRGSATIERPLTASLTLGWRLVRPQSFGEPMAETFTPIANPTGSVPLVIDNVLNDGRVYFTPVLRNLSSAKALVDFPLRDQAVRCFCTISTEGDPAEDGYWLLTGASTMRVYKVNDLAMTGPFITVPVPIAAVDPLTGEWRYTLLVGP